MVDTNPFASFGSTAPAAADEPAREPDAALRTQAMRNVHADLEKLRYNTLLMPSEKNMLRESLIRDEMERLAAHSHEVNIEQVLHPHKRPAPPHARELPEIGDGDAD